MDELTFLDVSKSNAQRVSGRGDIFKFPGSTANETIRWTPGNILVFGVKMMSGAACSFCLSTSGLLAQDTLVSGVNYSGVFIYGSFSTGESFYNSVGFRVKAENTVYISKATATGVHVMVWWHPVDV